MSAWWGVLTWFGDLEPGPPGGPEPDPGPPPEDGDPTPEPNPPESSPVHPEPEPIIERVYIEEWRTEHDARVCPVCGPLDGMRWERGEGPSPPAHVNCRCSRVVVEIEERLIGYTLPDPWYAPLLPSDRGSWR